MEAEGWFATELSGMSASNGILDPQFKYFEDQLEEWQTPHYELMENYEKADRLGEAAAYGLFLLDRITQRGERENLRITVSVAARLCRQYVWWYKTTSTLLDTIDNMESEGFPVDSAEGLRSGHRDVGMWVNEARNLKERLTSLKAGSGQPLEKVLDAIRSNAG